MPELSGHAADQQLASGISVGERGALCSPHLRGGELESAQQLRTACVGFFVGAWQYLEVASRVLYILLVGCSKGARG